MNSAGDFFYPDQHLRIDNTYLDAEAVAGQIVERFAIPAIVD